MYPINRRGPYTGSALLSGVHEKNVFFEYSREEYAMEGCRAGHDGAMAMRAGADRTRGPIRPFRVFCNRIQLSNLPLIPRSTISQNDPEIQDSLLASLACLE